MSSVQRAGRGGVGQLSNGMHDPAPGRRPVVKSASKKLKFFNGAAMMQIS
jgi:hypothetical protein